MMRNPFQVLVFLCLLALAACSASGKTASSSPSLTPKQSHTPTRTAPPIVGSGDCPAPGKARAATLPPLSAGSDQNMVFLLTTGSTGTLQRYAVTTGVTTEIISLAQTNISDAQLSPDGHWMLFVGLTTTEDKLQLVRLDGQDLQTLYCTPTSDGSAYLDSIQWSPNGQLVAFKGPTQQVTILNLSSGAVQTPFAPEFLYSIVGWLDNTRLYLRNAMVDTPPTVLYLLDLRRGSQQSQNDLLTVFQASGTGYPCWAAASSSDRTQLFVSQCTSARTGNGAGLPDTLEGPGSLGVESATGGSLQTLYTNATLGLVDVRAVTLTTLLVLVTNNSANGSVDTSQNGVWKLSTTGSGFTRLVAQGANQHDMLNDFAQAPWANGSRDGQFYAVEVDDTATNSASLVFGSLSGGTPKDFATALIGGNGPSLALVGWTID